MRLKRAEYDEGQLKNSGLSKKGSQVIISAFSINLFIYKCKIQEIKKILKKKVCIVINFFKCNFEILALIANQYHYLPLFQNSY